MVDIKDYDFSGYATRNDLVCGDGRVIKQNAFINQDGGRVPLIWNHDHTNPEAVLGHAILENRDDGVYAYCTFNDTQQGQHAKELVVHGDVKSLSIWANKLVQQGNDVLHGIIRELSLVLAGANEGAYIDYVLAHSDEESDSVYANWDEGELVVVCHSADNKDKDTEKGESEEMGAEGKKEDSDNSKQETIQDVIETMTEKQKDALYALLGGVLESKEAGKDKPDDKAEVKHSAEAADNEDGENDDDDGETGETVEDVINTLSEKQKKAMYAIVGAVIEGQQNGTENDENVAGGKDDMKHNVFENEGNNTEVLSHSEFEAIVSEAKRGGSLADSFLAHGIEQIDYLFPDAKNMEAVPGFIKRDDSWVAEFMGLLHKTPMSRIKSVHADITEADARAKGYVKGNEKTDELFTLLKRITTPTTVYKKQSLDRDDVVDITDFNVIAWLKSEMRMMLDEEIARAILVGDGRSASSPDKINEQNIRPIWTDDDKYTVKVGINVTEATTDDEKAKAFIKNSIKSRKHYKGSGNPIMYMSEDMLTNCLLLEDGIGHRLYDSVDKLATALRCRKVVAVPVMEGLTRVVGANTHELAGIYVNPKDYNVGADKGGAVNMFDDFDIDFNKQKYLIETRCSGALTVPFSAVAIEFVQPTA